MAAGGRPWQRRRREAHTTPIPQAVLVEAVEAVVVVEAAEPQPEAVEAVEPQPEAVEAVEPQPEAVEAVVVDLP